MKSKEELKAEANKLQSRAKADPEAFYVRAE
jgi:hypothetical protein